MCYLSMSKPEGLRH